MHRHSYKRKHEQYVAILTPEQWQKEYSAFDLGIDMDFETLDIHTTMAEVNYDSITGSFALPSIRNEDVVYRKFAFVIDEKASYSSTRMILLKRSSTG